MIRRGFITRGIIFKGEQGVAPEPGDTAPRVLSATGITPSTGPVGTVFSLTDATFIGLPAPSVSHVLTLTLAGEATDVTGDTADGQYTSTAEGVLTYTGTASNSEGSVSSAATAQVEALEPVLPDDPAVTELSTTAVTKGITIEMDKPGLFGRFVNGDLFFVPQEPTKWIGSSLPSSDVRGNGFIGNGAMLNPATISSNTNAGNSQGFDQYLELGGDNSPSSQIIYDPALNIDPDLSGPFELTTGSTIVKSVRRPENEIELSLDDEYPKSTWRTFDAYVRIHILDSVPYADTYAPSPSAAVKKFYRRSQISRDVCRNITLPDSMPSLADTLSVTPDDLGIYLDIGQIHRRTRIDRDHNYSGNIAPRYARLLMHLHDASLSDEDWWKVADLVISYGIQMQGICENGFPPQGMGAGQGGALEPWQYATGFLLGDMSFITAGREVRTNMTQNGIWLTEATKGRVPSFASQEGGVYYQPVLDGMENHPYNMPDGFGTNSDTRYGYLGTRNAMVELLPLILLQNGPGSLSGMEAILEGPMDITNQKAATTAYLSCYRAQNPDTSSANGKVPYWDDFYDIVVEEVEEFTPWTGTPEQLPQERNRLIYNDQYFTAITGGVSWDISAYDWATEPVTRTDIRYSLDGGVQWVVAEDVGAVGFIDTLNRGVSHRFCIRNVSASGPGAWSANYAPFATGGSPKTDLRGVRIPLGSPTTSPITFTVEPAVQMRKYPQWSWAEWDTAPEELDVTMVHLAAGDGYYIGRDSTVVTYQWLRNGVPIVGATDKYYTRKAADAEEQLSVELTYNDGINSPVIKTTNSVTCPSIVEPEEGIIIDSYFDSRFQVDYEDELNNSTATGGSVELHPIKTIEQIESISPGALIVKKEGARPTLTMPLSRKGLALKTYRAEIDVIVRMRYVDGAWTETDTVSPTDVSVLGSSGGALATATIPAEGKDAVGIIPVVIDFTVGATDQDLSVVVKVGIATGGKGGETVMIHRMKIYEIEGP